MFSTAHSLYDATMKVIRLTSSNPPTSPLIATSGPSDAGVTPRLLLALDLIRDPRDLSAWELAGLWSVAWQVTILS